MSSTDRGAPLEEKILDLTYTAKITVKRHKTKKVANANGYFDGLPETTAGELASIEFTSSTLAGLKAKIQQHTNLLEDE